MFDTDNLTDPNTPVLEFLEYYCNPENKLDYAVMLKGKWGVGKTYLINRFLKARTEKSSVKNLYVSLYGAASIKQIDYSLYRQLHPIFSSKGMKLAAAIGKAAIKATTRIDIDGDGKEDITISSNLPEIDLSEYFKTPSECLLVFDDLERCSVDVSDILGYINAFVEHEGFKVIIVANEDEILKKNNNNYAQIKEKLVGQTLTIRSTAQIALVHFLTLIRNESVKDFLEDHVQEIYELHSQSKTENLRLLKQALWDFERLASSFETRHWKNLEAVGVLLRVTLALAFEIRAGNLKEDQLDQLQKDSMLRLFRREKANEASFLETLTEKYPEVEFGQTIITSDALKALLFDGWISQEAVRTILNQSPLYTSPESLPSWKAAWHGWDLTDSQFESAVARVEKDFRERSIVVQGEIFQVFGLRLWFSSLGAIEIDQPEVVSECKHYVDDLRTAGRFPDPFSLSDEMSTGWEDLGFHEVETSGFKSCVDHFYNVAKDVARELLPKEGEKLLTAIKNDPQQYFRYLCVNEVTRPTFYEFPVLAFIPVRVFVDVILDLSPSAQSTAFIVFKSRYRSGELNNHLREEKPWLEEVKKELESRITTLGAMSRHRISKRISTNIDIYL